MPRLFILHDFPIFLSRVHGFPNGIHTIHQVARESVLLLSPSVGVTLAQHAVECLNAYLSMYISSMYIGDRHIGVDSPPSGVKHQTVSGVEANSDRLPGTELYVAGQQNFKTVVTVALPE